MFQSNHYNFSNIPLLGLDIYDLGATQKYMVYHKQTLLEEILKATINLLRRVLFLQVFETWNILSSIIDLKC